jgi:hypothetical protein
MKVMSSAIPERCAKFLGVTRMSIYPAVSISGYRLCSSSNLFSALPIPLKIPEIELVVAVVGSVGDFLDL